jgi:hypothetical protein
VIRSAADGDRSLLANLTLGERVAAKSGPSDPIGKRVPPIGNDF